MKRLIVVIAITIYFYLVCQLYACNWNTGRGRGGVDDLRQSLIPPDGTRSDNYELPLASVGIPPRTEETHSGGKDQKVLLISLDGFRWDYIKRVSGLVQAKHFRESHLWELALGGAYAPNGITSTFTTMTLPNHYTIVSGKYQEKHGIVSQSFYDPDTRTDYNVRNMKKETFGAEPIWARLMDLNKKSVACWEWFACDLWDFDEVHVKKYERRGYEKPCNEHHLPTVSKVVEWLSEDNMKLVLMYIDEPDCHGHHFGPSSVQVGQKLVELDTLIRNLTGELKLKEFFHKVNILIVSDHGMVDMTPGVPPLLPVEVRKDLFFVRSKQPTLWLVEPMEDKYKDTVDYFEQFPGVTVYDKDTGVEDDWNWHYRSHKRISQLLVIPKVGHVLHRDGGYEHKGQHGYDSRLPNMRPIFIANGPAIKSNTRVSREMSTADIYLLIFNILGMEPGENDGNPDFFPDFVQPEFLKTTQRPMSIT